MRIVIQRVNHASVKVDGETIGSIGKGYLLLLGVAEGDTKEMVDRFPPCGSLRMKRARRTCQLPM